MRYSLITGKAKDDGRLVVVVSPGDPRSVANAFKEIVIDGGVISGLAEAHLISSSNGLIRRKRFCVVSPRGNEAGDQAGDPEGGEAGRDPADEISDGPTLIPESPKTKKSKS